MYTASEYCFPESPEEAYSMLSADRKNAIVGGNLWMRMGKGTYHTLIDLSRLHLNYIRIEDSSVSIGAMATLRMLETSALLSAQFGSGIRRAVSPIVGTQFRNLATVGGTVAGRYGFSDLLNVFLALDAEVEFFHTGKMPLSAYLTGKPVRDVLLCVRIPADGRKAVYADQRMTATDFSIVACALCGLKDGSFRVTVGSRPGGPVRCEAAEAAFASGDTETAGKAVSGLTYGANLRGSAEYRSAIASVLARRAYEAWKEENNETLFYSE